MYIANHLCEKYSQKEKEASTNETEPEILSWCSYCV